MILHRRSRGLEFIHLLLQMVFATALYALWLLFFPLAGVSYFGVWNYALYGAVMVLTLGAEGFRTVSKPRDVLHYGVPAAAERSFTQIGIVTIGMLITLVVLKDVVISRRFIFSYLLLLFFVLLSTNLWLPKHLAAFIFRHSPLQNTLLVGSERKAELLHQWLEFKADYGLNIVGLLCDDAKERCYPVLGEMSDLEREMKRSRVRQVIFLETPPIEKIQSYVALCDRFGARPLFLSDWAEVLGRRILMSEDEGMHFFSFHSEPLECPWNRMIKRGLDIALSLPVVVFVLPIASALVWLFHRAQSPGPLIYKQLRSGVHGRIFAIRKFRSMHVNGNETQQATPGDQRIFAAGAWLRKTSMDELPQFINVLLGEMSIVGPRPHLPAHDELFEQAAQGYRLRDFVKPGITGLAQVCGFRGETRTEEDVVQRVQKDLQYVENWTLSLDAIIIAKTVRHVLRPPSSSY